MATRVKDRRKEPRVPAGFGAQVAGSGAQFDADVHNVSMSGVLLLVNQKVEEMTVVQMRLVMPARPGDPLPSCTFELTGAVVRCAPLDKSRRNDSKRKFELAVYFTDMPAEARAALQSFVTARLA